MFIKSKIIDITPKNQHILVKVVIDDFSVFQLAGNRDLKGSTVKFYVEATNSIDYIEGNRLIVTDDVLARSGGFLSDIGNNQGLKAVAEMHSELSQKDREIFNKNTPRVQLIDFILMSIHDIKAVAE